jgi:tetratricopeptide (TPR) repeat protein
VQATHWLLNYEAGKALENPIFQDAFDPQGELRKQFDPSDVNGYTKLINRLPDSRLAEARTYFARISGAARIQEVKPEDFSGAEGDALDKYFYFSADVLSTIRPGNQEAVLSLAGVLAAWRQDEEAMGRLNFVMANYPNVSGAYRLAGDIQRRIADRSPTNPGPRLATLEIYERAVKANPLDAEARVLLAETAWDIAKRLPTDDVDGVKSRMSQAAESFDAADEIRPYDVDQLLRESKTLIEMNLLSAAASRLQVARTIEPQNPELLMVIGDAAMAGGQVAGAESAYRQVLSADDKSVPAYLNYSSMLASQERMDEAEELLNRGLEKLPGNAQLLDAMQKFRAIRDSAASQPAATQPG